MDESKYTQDRKKLSYVIYNKNLNVIIGVGIYYETSLDNLINKSTKDVKKQFLYMNLIFIVIVVFVLIISIIVSFYFSNKLRNIFKKYDSSLKELLEKVKFESLHDNLTKIANRKFFNERLQEEFYKAERYKTPLSIAMIDIDFFKQVNDTYGHEAGDLVLKKLASFCNTNIRKSDIFARWGGEEFMFIFPHTKLEEAVNICEKIKYGLQNDKNVQNPVKFAISCGVVELKKDDTIKSLLKRVDNLLYKAKENGRDRIEFE